MSHVTPPAIRLSVTGDVRRALNIAKKRYPTLSDPEIFKLGLSKIVTEASALTYDGERHEIRRAAAYSVGYDYLSDPEEDRRAKVSKFISEASVQFLVIGRDGTDDKAMERRLKARPAHIEMGEKLWQSGNFWYGAALWDDNEQMIGSMYLVDFPSEKELHEWLEIEPYITGKVWQKLEIQKCNVRDPWQFNRTKEWFESRRSPQD